MTGPCRACTWLGPDLRLELHVQPRAARDEVKGIHGDRLRLRLTAPPADGRANDRLLAFLAGEFAVAREAVTLLRGTRSRQKSVLVRSPNRLPGWLPAEGEPS